MLIKQRGEVLASIIMKQAQNHCLGLEQTNLWLILYFVYKYD